MNRGSMPGDAGKTMRTALLRHLARSPAVQVALKKELGKGVAFLVASGLVAGMLFYFRPKPLAEVLWSTGFGLGAMMLLWLVAAIRTVRAVMREEGLLER